MHFVFAILNGRAGVAKPIEIILYQNRFAMQQKYQI